MFCSKCGVKQTEGLKVCTRCGAKAGKITISEETEKAKKKSQKSSRSFKSLNKGKLVAAITVLVMLLLAGFCVGGYYLYRYWSYKKASEALAKELQPTWNETLTEAKSLQDLISRLKRDINNKKTENLSSTVQNLAKSNANLQAQLETVKAAKATDEAAAAKQVRAAEIQKQIQEAMSAFYQSYYSYLDFMQQVLNDPLGVSKESLNKLVNLAGKAEADYDSFKRISGAISGCIDRAVFDLASDVRWIVNQIKDSDDLIAQVTEEGEREARSVVEAFGQAWVGRDYDTASRYMTENFKADERILAWAANPVIETSTSSFEIISSERMSYSQYKFEVAEHLDTGESLSGYFIVVKSAGKWLIDQVSS